MGERAVVYREKNGITKDIANGTAVNVVTMVFGNMGDDSATGVVFTRNGHNGKREIEGEYLTNAQGEDVVAGVRTGKNVELLKKEMPKSHKELSNACEKLEKHFREPQDIEFTIEQGKFYLLQTRTAKMSAGALVKTSVDMVKEKLIDKGNTGMTNTKQFEEEVSNWAELLNQPVPKIRRMSLDIEVETDGMRLPDVKIADKKVTAIGFEASDGMRRVFVLKRDGIQEGENDLDENIEVVFYEKDQEKKLIEDAFGLVKKYPVLITYNGDGFDLPYLYNRAKRLGISEDVNPLYMMKDFYKK